MVLSVTLLSRLCLSQCVFMCVPKKNTYTIRGPSRIVTAKERVRSCFSPFFFSLVIMIASISVVVSRTEPDGGRIVCIRATFSVVMDSTLLLFSFSYLPPKLDHFLLIFRDIYICVYVTNI